MLEKVRLSGVKQLEVSKATIRRQPKTAAELEARRSGAEEEKGRRRWGQCRYSSRR